MTVVVWSVIGAVLVALLLSAWLMDRSVRRRGSRVVDGRDIWLEVREGRRDGRIVDNTPELAAKQDVSWTSWKRRDQR